ncbi:unnamed protein product [Clonostachys chloroleuca]|uniref:DUF2428 domain-containing protein n=1 Tax=Clonostachys chloroleuca TaxID=1926264 RepID=A0AA35M1B6_9HYPO|nr:unnamed protein product [Clonostachys chloroleuca]
MSSHSEKLANELASHQELLAWIENQPKESQIENANISFAKLLQEAGQPKSVSGNACVRLCGFVEHFSKSKLDQLQSWAFSEDIAQQLFTFYMEWNESDHHRSMKLVLDLLTRLQKRNPNVTAAKNIEKSLLDYLISIIVGLKSKPVAKSAIKTLDYFVSKNIYSLNDIKLSYVRSLPEKESLDEIEVWHSFFGELFSWMKNHFVCPTAGRLAVCLYRRLRNVKNQPQSIISPRTWHQWLLEYIEEDPSLLESVKNYIFLPLFNAERTEALEFLRMMATSDIVASNRDIDVNLPALLQLAALETGKRVGLVEEPSLNTDSQENDGKSSILMNQDILNSVLAHPSHEVRSLAFSLLITSPSTTRPYSLAALNLLRQHIGTYFADPYAKFRVDVMARARDMFKRIRGAICVLKRSIPRVRAKALKRKAAERATAEGVSPEADAQPILYRSNLIDLPEGQLVHCLEYHAKFLRWYIGFLCSELTPTASYQRHVGSLKAISSILRLESDPKKDWGTDSDQEIFYDLVDKRWARALFDLVMDPFDDVRELSSAATRSILSDMRYRKFSLSGASRSDSPVVELQDLSNRANELSRRTARADHSDGAARACQLLYRFFGDETAQLGFISSIIDKLEAKIALAQSNLGQAVLEDPVHGDFSALRYIWQIVSTQAFSGSSLDAGQAVQNRLVSCCEQIWDAVRDILCDDSPEGHLPQELEEVDGINTKDILSYSFRAIHESSNLIRAMALTVWAKPQAKSISPSLDSFKRMGDLSFIQLSTLRHRGAFSTVSSTFSTCCQQTQYLGKEGAGSNILDAWYQGTMSAIFAQVSTTRRSAGIPSLMTGILSADAPSPSFEQVMEKLIEISGVEAFVRETDGSNLPQVHAFNCLKDIFKSSFLTSMGNKSEKYLPQCLELAANGLRSEVWAIRNCGLILLRSLIDCLFGSNESKAMIELGWDGKANRIPYHRYSTLPRVLVNLLESGHQMMSVTASSAAGAESVFPALDIVRRAGPPDELREELMLHISTYLGSPVWHVREMAARTLCSCLLHDKWLVIMQDLLQQAINGQTKSSQNRIHGVLVALKFVIERLSEVSPERLTPNLSSLVQLLHETKIDSHYIHCPDILAAYVEVINLIWSLLSSLESEFPSKTLEVSISTSSDSALLKIQRIKHQMLAAKFSDSSLDVVNTLLLGNKVGVNTMLTALETLPQLWNVSSASSEVLAQFSGLYIDICLENSSLDVQAIALENLADIIEHFLAQTKDTELLRSLPLEQLLESLLSHTLNPSLSNAILRVSGSAVALMKLFGRLSTSKLQSWGIMMADAGLDDKTFDSRFASAQSLHAFFLSVGPNCTGDDFLPALVSLYDTLNDDDDEVREVGSLAVRSIIGQPLVPIEAANRLLQWLSVEFSNSASFKAVVAARITGASGASFSNQDIPWKSADEQFDAALKFDDSLFVIEEQNLFIDEIRETSRWVSVHESLAWNAEDSTSKRLDDWLQRGLARLIPFLTKEDGPVGWASDPEMFSLCSRIILASASLEQKGHASAALLEALKAAKDALGDSDAQKKHISSLLVKPLE